jgi:two-component system, OmpR family, sensor histidine kinase KdpD
MRWRQWTLRLGSETPPTWLGVLAAVATVAAGALLAYPVKSVAPAVSLGVVFIPGVLLISTLWGLRLGLLTALLSALAFNWFHIPPVGRFTIADNRDLVALVVFVIAAVISGTLAEFARARVAEAERSREDANRALAELSALAEERDRMQAEAIEAEALRRSDELKTALLRSVSHDLRTPLTSMIAAGAALDSPTATPAERHELSEAIVEEGQRLSRLVENLLDVSRLESGAAEPHREPVDVAELLEVARDSVGRGRELVRLGLEPRLPELRADPAQLERAFANLFENAIRHGDGRPVMVRSRVAGDRLDLRVVDQGPGIAEAEWERIFEPFYRGANGAAARSGTGLGLAIAKGFVEANGGEIAVESLPGQGTSFVVSFTVAPVEAG